MILVSLVWMVLLKVGCVLGLILLLISMGIVSVWLIMCLCLVRIGFLKWVMFLMLMFSSLVILVVVSLVWICVWMLCGFVVSFCVDGFVCWVVWWILW